MPLPTELALLAEDDFLSLATLSSSQFQTVLLVTPRVGPHTTLYVLKSVERRWAFRMRQQASPQAELSILRRALDDDHAPVPRLIAAFLSPTHYHIALAHAAGGDLWSLLEQHAAEDGAGGLEERLVQRWTAELVCALEWLHGSGWVHRDIKPHNLLIGADGRLLLTDFNSAAPLAKDGRSVANGYARALVGTPDYIAPEVLLHAERVVEDSFSTSVDDGEEYSEARAYGLEVDWWSVGVVVYELLYGQAPFYTPDIAGTYERIVNWKDHLTFPATTGVSTTAHDFLSSMLSDAPNRPSLSALKSSPWLSATPWHSLATLPPLYVPPSFALPSPPSNASSPLIEQPKLFDFSAFFSSPGLSILRSSPAQGTADESAYFAPLTFLPRTLLSAPALEPRSTKRVEDLRAKKSFETPARPRGLTSGPAERGSSGRGRRMVSDVEAWKEMQEHAWEVAMTAKKARRPNGRLEGLEARQRDVLREVDEIEVRYSKLFEMINAESGA